MATIDNPCDFGTPEPCGVNPAYTYTRYPCDFDDPRPSVDTRGMPPVIDLQTPVKGEVVNRHREAILAVENELGIQPSGTFTTVRSRLDALESLLCSIWQSIIDVGSPVDVLLNGTTVVKSVEELNFFGSGVTVTAGSSTRANIDISGGICYIDGYAPVHEALTVTAPGQTAFDITFPAYKNLLLFFVGGIKQEIGDYVVDGYEVTWNGTPLVPADVVEVFYNIEGKGDGYEPFHEGIPVTVAGQTEFILSETAWSGVLLFFVDGIKQNITDYTVDGYTVTWNGAMLIPTDVVEVLYYKLIPATSCALTVADQGTVAETNVTYMDFVGPAVTATGDGAGRVTVTVVGANTIMYQEVFSATPGQTDFVVTGTPINQQAVELFIDGVSQTVGIDYTLGVDGYTVTYSGIPPLVGGEEVVVKYFEELSIYGVPGLPAVLISDNTTGGDDIDFEGTSTCIDLLDPVNPQDAATKAYVDGYEHGLPTVLCVDNTTGGDDIDFENSSRGINLLDPLNNQDAATKAYVDGYIQTGYLGIDVYVSSTLDLPAAVLGVITLASNTVYGIDDLVDLGTDRIVFSAGSKIVGGGGSSSTSELRTSNALGVVTIGAADTSVDGVILQNTGSGPAMTLSSGADNYSIVDTKFISAGVSSVVVTAPGQGQITDSFVDVPTGGEGILIDDAITTFLVKNTLFKGVASGDGYGINLDSATTTKVISQISVDLCRFEDLDYAFRQNSDMNINGNLSIVGCSAVNIDTFIRTEVGSTTQCSTISSNSTWNLSLFNVGLAPGGNHVFRGNISQGVAQTETPII